MRSTMAMVRGSLRWSGIARIEDHLIQAPAGANLPLPPSASARVLRAAAVLGALITGAVHLSGVRRVVVEGTSMLPTLAPGDRLVLVRCARPAPGDLVAVPDPRDPARVLVKRVAA